MSYFLTDVAGALIVLGTLVFVHEFGHYAAAKLFGVRVEVFSLGFGKRLWGFKRGDTDYRLSALPFGGYVRMSGENPMEEHTGDPGEFSSHPRWQRFVIALAGPAMNVILAIVVVAGIFMVSYPAYLDQPARIGFVEAKSPAAKAGLEAGDLIMAVDGQAVDSWKQVSNQLAPDAGKSAKLGVQRADKTVQISLPLNFKPGVSFWDSLGLYGQRDAVILHVRPGFPAARAGIKPGDKVVAVDQQPIYVPDAAINDIVQAKGAPVEITLQRGAELLNLSVAPQATAEKGEPQYAIGVEFDNRMPGLGFSAAVGKSLLENRNDSMLVFTVLHRLVTHQTSIKEMAGPVGIAQISGEATRTGILPLLDVMALISLNLAIVNLLPFPILDGGLIVLLLIEGTLRRDIKREVKEMVYQAAFVFLVIFAAIIIYNDISKTALGRFLPHG